MLALDEAQGFPRIKAPLGDKAAIDERHGEKRAHAHGVIERHDAQGALAARVKVLRDMRHRRRALGAVAARHALGPPGRARGVEHQREILSARGGRGIGGIGAQLLERHGAGCPADADPRQIFAPRVRPRPPPRTRVRKRPPPLRHR